MNATGFEIQKKTFDDFVEGFQDRMNLIVKDGIELVFGRNFLQFGNFLAIRYSAQTLVPELIFKNIISSTEDTQTLQNIMANYDEIVANLKHYVFMYMHLSEWIDKSVSTSEDYALVKDALDTIIRNDSTALDGKRYFIRSDKTPDGKDVKIYLSIDAFGNAKRKMVMASYIIHEVETGEETHISEYKIDKYDFASDTAYQLSTHTCTHIDK